MDPLDILSFCPLCRTIYLISKILEILFILVIKKIKFALMSLIFKFIFFLKLNLYLFNLYSVVIYGDITGLVYTVNIIKLNSVRFYTSKAKVHRNGNNCKKNYQHIIGPKASCSIQVCIMYKIYFS